MFHVDAAMIFVSASFTVCMLALIWMHRYAYCFGHNEYAKYNGLGANAAVDNIKAKVHNIGLLNPQFYYPMNKVCFSNI